MFTFFEFIKYNLNFAINYFIFNRTQKINFMKKNYLLKNWVFFCVFSLVSIFGANAQVNTYGFSSTSGTYTPLVAGTTSGLTATADDNLSAALPIGFNFIFNGVTYTTFKVSSNGVLFFGNGNSAAANGLGTLTAAQRPGLAPLWDDLICTSGVTYQLSGTAPNQKLTVEWKEMRWFYNAAGPVISFQVILTETTNQIDFVYKQEATAVSTSGGIGTPGASIGLMGSVLTDFISLQNSNTTPTRSTTVSTNNILTKPANGQVYSWIAAPVTPPTPTEVAGTPDCVTGTNFEIVGSPESGVTWYVQTTATGTSTANPMISPYNVLGNGTYYVRAYNATFDVWSVASSSIIINSIPVAPTPPAPFATLDPTCVTTGSELNFNTPPLGTTYYWQATSDGTLTTYHSTPITVPTSGTYYLRAFETATSCWSEAESVTVTVQTDIPAAPTAAITDYNICGGLSDFDITATSPLSTQTATQSTSFGTNLISTGAGDTYPIAVPALPLGATVVSAKLLLSNVNAINGSYRSEIRVGLSGIHTLGATQISAIGSGGLITPDPQINLTGYTATTGGTLNLLLTETANDGGATTDATFGEVILEIVYSLPANLNWYDAATAGTQIGTASPFDAIGNSVLADPSTNGTYEFYAETVDGACTSATRTLVTVNVIDVSVALTAIDETCIGYANGSFEISDTLCGVTPFLVDVDGGGFGSIPTDLAAGTYTVTVQDDNGNNSAPMTLTIGTTDTFIPEAPTAVVTEYSICAGETSQMIEAVSGGSGTQNESSGTLNISIPDDNLTGISSDLIISGIPSGATITDISVTINISHTWTSDVDITLTGPNSTTIDLSSDNGGISGPGYVNTVISSNGVTPINGATTPMTGVYAPEGNILSLLSIPNGTWKLNVSDDSEDDFGTFQNWSISISYSIPAATIEWYDAASNGVMQGTGSPFETIGTGNPIITSPATNGIYEFYAGALAGGCYSTSRTLVTVNVLNVNVELTPINIECNAAATGSFEISDTLCGAIPFEVNVDGGAFGPIPTDLVAGTYSIIVRDDNGDLSAPYTLVITEADAPSGAYMEDITDNGGQVSWTANGNETEWNVEWGLPGFTPGTGTEIGSTQAMDTFAIITGLDANTNYDVYVSANCGVGSTTGGWDMISWTTDCAVYGLPFVETFEDNSETRVCWYNINEVGNADWTYETGDASGYVTTAFEGTKNARFVSEDNFGDPITKLASPRFDFTGQDSVAVIFSYAQADFIGDQNETKVYSIGSSSVWTELAHYTNDVSAWTTDTIYVADTTTQIAFEGINNWGAENVVDYVQFLPCTLTPGVDGSADVCRADGTFDLNSVVTLGETFGKWSFEQNPNALNDNIVDVTALPTGTFEFLYIVKTPCATDTTIAMLTIFPPSMAGNDGTISACRNEPIYLLSALTGTVDLGGQWYNSSNNPTTVNVTTSNLPGNYNFDYVVSNGVCPNDTANILVTVGTCDYLDIQELVFGDMNVYPNPTDGLVFISNASSSETFSYELMDVKGQVLSVKEAAINGTTTTEISLEKLEPGIYMIRVFNSEAEKTFRIIKQ